MLKFGTPTIALPLAIKKCTVQTGCTVVTPHAQRERGKVIGRGVHIYIIIYI